MDHGCERCRAKQLHAASATRSSLRQLLRPYRADRTHRPTIESSISLPLSPSIAQRSACVARLYEGSAGVRFPADPCSLDAWVEQGSAEGTDQVWREDSSQS